MLLTRPPLEPSSEKKTRVRLACVRHAASVCPEPGSNSPSKFCGVYACESTHAFACDFLANTRYPTRLLLRRLHDSKNIDVCYPHRHSAGKFLALQPQSAYCCFSLFGCSGALWWRPPRWHTCPRRKREHITTQGASQAGCRAISALHPLSNITHDHWPGAVGTASLAWRLTSRYDSPTKLIGRSCAD